MFQFEIDCVALPYSLLWEKYYICAKGALIHCSISSCLYSFSLVRWFVLFCREATLLWGKRNKKVNAFSFAQYSTHIDYHYCDFNCCCWSVYFVERYSKLSIRLAVCFYEMWWQDQGCESSVDKFFLLLQFVLLEQRVILNS